MIPAMNAGRIKMSCTLFHVLRTVTSGASSNLRARVRCLMNLLHKNKRKKITLLIQASIVLTKITVITMKLHHLTIKIYYKKQNKVCLSHVWLKVLYLNSKYTWTNIQRCAIWSKTISQDQGKMNRATRFGLVEPSSKFLTLCIIWIYHTLEASNQTTYTISPLWEFIFLVLFLFITRKILSSISISHKERGQKGVIILLPCWSTITSTLFFFNK